MSDDEQSEPREHEAAAGSPAPTEPEGAVDAKDGSSIARRIPLDDFRLDHTPAPRPALSWLKITFVLACLALIAIGAVWLAVDHWTEQQAPSSQRPSTEHVEPELLRASKDSGAEVRAMVGRTESMMLVVRSDPEGAVLIVDGVTRGETPAGVDTHCYEDALVVVELRAHGFRRWRRELPCQPGIELTFTPKLRPR